MLDCVQEILPLGADGWKRACDSYNAKKERGHPYREMEAFRGKFKRLKNEKKPTGDPDCPEDVKRAKRINVEMERKQDIASFGSNSNDGSETDSSCTSSAPSSHMGNAEALEMSAKGSSSSTTLNVVGGSVSGYGGYQGVLSAGNGSSSTTTLNAAGSSSGSVSGDGGLQGILSGGGSSKFTLGELSSDSSSEIMNKKKKQKTKGKTNRSKFKLHCTIVKSLKF